MPLAPPPRLLGHMGINSLEKNVSSAIVPMRTSAVVGLRYIRDLIVADRLPAPRLIYLDAAHMYPETQFEADAAWEVLAPGGYLIGDDYDHYWPEVQQSINEFVLRKGASAFVDPAIFTASWPSELLKGKSPWEVVGRVELLDAKALGIEVGTVTPLLKQSQWILKKAPLAAESTARVPSESKSSSLPIKLRCCLNGWDAYGDRFNLGPRKRCLQPQPFLQQEVCRGNESKSVHCRFKFVCS